jgi:hypothetical protein
MNSQPLLPEEYRHDLQIIRETGEQVMRDFQNEDLKIIFSGDNFKAFDELKNQLIPFIRNMQKSISGLNAMLYRVDISESELRTAMKNSTQSNEELLAELIIRREFKKVLTRRYFKKS